MSEIFKRLRPQDSQITPFKAYKKWVVDVDNVDSSSGYVSYHGINYTGHFETTEEKDTSGVYKRNIYHLVNKLFYIQENDPAETFTNDTREVLEKNFITNAEDVPFPTHISASITHITVPQQRVGERIRPGSVSIKSKSGSLDGEYFDDDGIGNLYSRTLSASWDSSTSSSYWPPSSSLKGYWKFDNPSDPYVDYSGNGHQISVTGSSLFTTQYDSSSAIEGLVLKKSTGKGGVRLTTHEQLVGQDKQTWTLWFKPDYHENSGLNSRIISRDVSEYFGLVQYGDYSGDNKANAVFYFGNGINRTFTNALDADKWHFAAFSIDYNVGSQSIYLYNSHTDVWVSDSKHTGGIRKWNGSNTGSTVNSNKRGVVLGCNSEHHTNINFNYNNYTGSWDEIRYYDTNLSANQIYALKDFPRGAKSSWVGDIWYNQGQVVVKTQETYKNLALGNNGSDGYELSYDSQVTIYEHEWRCEARETEFNVTINGSLMEPETLDTGKVIGVATHSLFAPYVTTIGLYDDNYSLLAIGKLARPIKSSVETPMTFVLRMDL